MDTETRKYIDSLSLNEIPWNRMFTAYGTAEKYGELIPLLEQTTDFEQWEKTFNALSDFEHQSTMFPPAPFALVFLVRILEKILKNDSLDSITRKLLDICSYYTDVCEYAENMEHAEPLSRFPDLLKDENLLPEDYTEDDLMEIFENPETISDELFYSFYYYSGIVLSQIPAILEPYDRFSEERKKFTRKFDKKDNNILSK